MKLTSKIDRIAAWVLLICVMLYVLTGFDIQRRFLAPGISSLIHLKYLFIPAQAAFAYHTTTAIYRALKRRGLRNEAVTGIVAVYLAVNLALMIYYLYIQFA